MLGIMNTRKNIYRAAAIVIVFAAVITASMLSSNAATDTSGTYKDINWSYSNGILTFTSDKESAEIVNDQDKKAWGQYQKQATKLVFGDNISSLGFIAFDGFTKVKTIDFGDVCSLGQQCFADCTSLKTVTIPDNLSYFGNQVFDRCTGLETVYFGKNTFADGCNYAVCNPFSGCTALKSFVIAEGNKNFHLYGKGLYINNIFMSYPQAAKETQYTMESGTKVIVTDAFDSNVYIEEINIPETVEVIGYYAFKDLSSLKSLTIPSSVISMGRIGFSTENIVAGCESLKTVYNKSNQTFKVYQENSGTYHTSWKNKDTGVYALEFTGPCTIMQVRNRHYEIYQTFTRNGVKYQLISETPFLRNDDLNKGTIAANVKVVSNPNNVVTGDKVVNGYTYNISEIGRVYAVDGIKYRITSVKNHKVAVVGCTSEKVKSVTIGNTVKIDGTKYYIRSIGKNAFKGYSKLKTITIKNSNISAVGSYAVKGIYSKAKIKVPKSKVKTYKKMFTKGTGFTSKMKVTYY